MAPSPNTTAPKIVEVPNVQMIDIVLQSLDDAKAEATVAIDITGKSPLSDHMVVTSGRSNRHGGAVADHDVGVHPRVHIAMQVHDVTGGADGRAGHVGFTGGLADVEDRFVAEESMNVVKRRVGVAKDQALPW